MENQTKPRILVVDDIIDNIEILGSILRPEYDVIMAMTGQKALLLAGGPNPPDLILLDIVMPEMDGSEVCRRLKGSPHTARIPVIFVSARDEEIDDFSTAEAAINSTFAKSTTLSSPIFSVSSGQ